MVRKRGISPKLDLVFKKIFGDKKNSDILSDFLSAVLGVTNIESIEILDNEMISDVFVEKFSRLDLRINLNGNTSINVEIQVKNYENYKDRTLFYWSKLYTQGFKEGQDYATLYRRLPRRLASLPRTRNLARLSTRPCGLPAR